MAGRTDNQEGYRFGFNGQERDDDVAGTGNINGALFWEYDSRLGNRWNMDPVYTSEVSRYVVFGNNPIYFKDPLGDFRTKFGAKLYKFFHGGEVSQNKYSGSSHFGEWYVSKKIDEEGTRGRGRLSNGSVELGQVPVTEKIRYGWKDKYNPGNLIDRTVSGIDYSHKLMKSRALDAINYLDSKSSDIWNSDVARYIIPDYFTISLTQQGSSGPYLSEEETMTFIFRGKDPGIYINSSTGFGAVSSVGGDVGVSFGRGYYMGDPREMSSDILGGWQSSLSVGVGDKFIVGGSINGGVDVSTNAFGKISTVTFKGGLSVGWGVSTPVLQGGAGVSYSTSGYRLVKF